MGSRPDSRGFHKGNTETIFFLEDGRDVSRIVPFPPNALNTVFFRKKRNGVLPREKVL